MPIKAITGMKDNLSPEVELWQFIEKTAREHFENYFYQEIRTPLLEETALFKRGIGENTGVVSKEMYQFTDKGGDEVTLRPEGTASVVRAYIEHNLTRQDPVCKLYYVGPMFRYERPQRGRLRQFHQIGVELLGPTTPQSDVEVIGMLDTFIQKVGVKDYELQINCLGQNDSRKKYVDELKTYLSKYQNSLGEEDKNRLQTNPLRVLDSKDEKIQDILNNAPVITDFLNDNCKLHWEKVLHGLSELKISFKINPRIVRGLDYYQQTAFEVISNNLGSQNAFAGGGRYDSLVKDLGGPDISGVGFAIGVERLVMLCQAEFKPSNHKKIYMAFMGEKAWQKTIELTSQLRQSGLTVEMAYEDKSLKSQLKRANKLNFSHVVILGEDELKKQKVQVKDFDKHTEEEVNIVDLGSYLSRIK